CNIKLKHSYCSQYIIAAAQGPENLYSTLFGKMGQSLGKLFGFHGVFQPYTPEVLGRKTGNACKFQGLFFRECVTDLYGAMVMNTYYIPGKGLFNLCSVLGHKYCCIGDYHLSAESVMNHL